MSGMGRFGLGLIVPNSLTQGAEKELFMLRHVKGLFGLCVLVVVVSLFIPQFTGAQTGTTSLRGTILDKSGATISGATLHISNPEVGLEREAVSGDNGQYDFVALPPGTYTL